ncbi:D-alanyl-D-alanine carboxypeptidase (penicillin-binding protein 5/6) [Keratinibaculum paraultunense]|uniref:serine-type D-Ala-D-Ala carboxypeptidase n=1 Tax=Keratinibaculum paraultunense TaxID=1278232 RepID=A0A4V2UUL4_9FIRM|nr:D-alanyl-D-alanine carboxypeptidase family protein [Keratinibaculum paraultunense]QQY80641.1 D-alanyl-D-alanine carboxypeptidase [Keratinibaculum paraultunense]TCS91374.1 D-alanyl-D-alanine carboxypeptidase (penicillin-binding protein 5/6) [Keratinibaculum paraultunense]
MKKNIFILLLTIILFISSYSFGQKPNISAQSAILMDKESGRILIEYNPYIRLPMASTTKIMTALIALERGNINDKIEIKKHYVGVEGSSIYLYEGEIISLEDLLYGLMLRSGNDAAIAIADYIGGNIEQFVFMMNQKAKIIGANNTNFVNPHGLHDDNHYTTAYDLALITKEAMNIEKFTEIVKSKMWKAHREKNNLFYNKNNTLWEYEGGDGVKIGYTIRAGRCLVSSATRNGRTIIAIVLNDRNWFNDCYNLLDYGFENFRNYVIFDRGQCLREIAVINGRKDFVSVVIKNLFTYPLKEEELDKVKIYIDLPNEILAPIEKNQVIGKARVYLDGVLIHEEDIISKEAVAKLGFFESLIKTINTKDKN